MSNDIVIYGAGGLGRETALLIRQINEVKPTWNLLGFYDDGKQKGELVDGLGILGGTDDLRKQHEELSVVIAIADPIVRRNVVSELSDTRLSFPVLIHPKTVIGNEARNSFGRGVIITAGNIITTNVSLQDFVIVNLSCTIGHDVTVGSFCTVMPGCHISGFVEIGETCLIGTGAIVLPHLKVGRNARIGAGAVVTKNVPSAATVKGVPAKED